MSPFEIIRNIRKFVDTLQRIEVGVISLCSVDRNKTKCLFLPYIVVCTPSSISFMIPFDHVIKN